MAYVFTSDNFSAHIPHWDSLFSIVTPDRVLELGSHEGRSTLYAIESVFKHRGGGLVTSIDSWVDPATEERFFNNVAVARARHPSVDVEVRKGEPVTELARLLTEGRSEFYDIAYVSGITLAPDVLTALSLAYRQVRVGGVIIANDYLWTSRQGNPVTDPKAGVDAFTNLFYQRVGVMRGPLYQLYMHRVA